MTKRLFLIILCVFSVHAATETILVMDSLEFKTVDHGEGKWRYINQITEVLKKMRLKQGDFDAMSADKNVVYELIQSDARWAEITKEIEKSCKKPAQKKSCERLAKIRYDIFDYIKDNPEGVIGGSEPGAAAR